MQLLKLGEVQFKFSAYWGFHFYSSSTPWLYVYVAPTYQKEEFLLLLTMFRSSGHYVCFFHRSSLHIAQFNPFPSAHPPCLIPSKLMEVISWVSQFSTSPNLFSSLEKSIVGLPFPKFHPLYFQPGIPISLFKFRI